jgi:hypothetical protein
MYPGLNTLTTRVCKQKMRGQKVGKEEYKMVSVPGHTGGAYDNMSAERLKQELQALRASEVYPFSLYSYVHPLHPLTLLPLSALSSPVCPCVNMHLTS